MTSTAPSPLAHPSAGLATRRPRRLTAPMAEERGDRPRQEIAEHTRDLALVARSRDREAFRRLFEHYGPRVKAYLRRLGADEEAAEDLTQDVFVAIWGRAAQFDPAKASVSTWVFTIARNKRIDALRRDRMVPGGGDELDLEIDPAPRGDATAEFNQTSARVMRAVETLPEEQKRLLKIFYFDDKPHSAIAAELGLPLGTVKSRLRLAIAKLRALLGDDRQ